MRLALRTAILAAGALAATAPAAGADIIALATTVDQSTSPPNLQLAKVDASTGTFLSLPAGVNTADQENHAVVTADGKRLVFERTSISTGTDRIVMTDLTTGHSTDVFTGFEAASSRPTSPAITPDGKTVLTGGSLQTVNNIVVPAVTLTDVTTFPAGPPYAQSVFKPGYGFGAGTLGKVQDPAATGSAPGSQIAYRLTHTGTNGELILGNLGAGGSVPLGSSSFQYAHPALGSPGGSPIIAFEQRPVTAAGGLEGGDIVFRPATLTGFRGTPTPIPGVDTAASETRPAFTPDGRYLGFIRTAGDDRLLIWDSQTQTIVNGTGFDLGHLAVSDSGTLSLYEQIILRFTGITNTGTVNFDLASASGVGILVQRVVGHHKLFGRTVPTLKLVGRVPFGKFAKGKGHVKWDMKVNGKRLRRGTYQVTCARSRRSSRSSTSASRGSSR